MGRGKIQVGHEHQGGLLKRWHATPTCCQYKSRKKLQFISTLKRELKTETLDAISPGQSGRAKGWETCFPMKTTTASFAKLSRVWDTMCDAQLSGAGQRGTGERLKCGSVAKDVWEEA